MTKLFFFCLCTIIILTVAPRNNVQAQTTPVEIKTDVIARKAIKYMNMNMPDSVYFLTGKLFKQQLSPVLWNSVYKTQLSALLPITDITFTGSTNDVNKYTIQGKIKLSFYASLDSACKLLVFGFQPYQEELTASVMNTSERKTDTLARKILTLINHKQADSIYLFAGDVFKSQLDAKKWKAVAENGLFPLIPLPLAVFVGSKNGINKYKVGQFQFLLSMDAEGKFYAMLLQPYHDDAEGKTGKVLDDNPLKTRLDSTVDKVLSAYIRSKGNVGLSTGVYYNGEDHFYNYGETRQGNSQLPTNHTLYEIGSITKTFTATLLAIAVEQGKLSLEMPIIKFLPDSVASNPALKTIKLKQLANHTSGLPRLPADLLAKAAHQNQPYANYSIKDMFSYLMHFKTIRQPGAKYEYSNLAVGLLGVILERVYNKPYEELIKQYITQPAGLTETKIILSTADAQLLAQGYNEKGAPVPAWGMLSFKAAGALKSTAYDMLTYGKLQLLTINNSLLMAIKLTQQVTFDDNYNKIGLIWNYFPQDNSIIEHGGATGGYRSMVCVNKSKKIVVTTLTNNASTGDALGLQLIAVLGALQNGK